MAESSDAPPVIDLVAQIAALTMQVQENSNRLMALEEENTTLRHENCMLQEHLSTVEATPQRPHDLWFQVPVIPMQLLFTPDQGGSSSQPPVHQAAATSTSVTTPSSTVVGHDTTQVDLMGASIVQLVMIPLVHTPPPPPVQSETDNS